MNMSQLTLKHFSERAHPLDLLYVYKKTQECAHFCLLFRGKQMGAASFLKPDEMYILEVATSEKENPKKICQMKPLMNYVKTMLEEGYNIMWAMLENNPIQKREFENEQMWKNRVSITDKEISELYEACWDNRSSLNPSYLSSFFVNIQEDIGPCRVLSDKTGYGSHPFSAKDIKLNLNEYENYAYDLEFIKDLYTTLGIVNEWPKDKNSTISKINNIMISIKQLCVEETQEKKSKPESLRKTKKDRPGKQTEKSEKTQVPQKAEKINKCQTNDLARNKCQTNDLAKLKKANFQNIEDELTDIEEINEIFRDKFLQYNNLDKKIFEKNNDFSENIQSYNIVRPGLILPVCDTSSFTSLSDTGSVNIRDSLEFIDADFCNSPRLSLQNKLKVSCDCYDINCSSESDDELSFDFTKY